MRHSLSMANQLSHVHLALTGAWVSTDAPRYVPHDEWALSLRLCESPFRTVSVLRNSSEVSWGLNPAAPAAEQELAVKFFPDSWRTSDRVRINFGWQSTVVDDPTLKADPPTSVFVTLPGEAQTGRLASVCDVPAHDVSVLVFALKSPLPLVIDWLLS